MNNPSTTGPAVTATPAAERAARLAEQLRANLKRRKAQARAAVGDSQD
jgi:hypothetical protein